MTKRTSADIRREFIEFFAQRGHTFVPSSSLLPADDPTLLFANAGMNQFKPLFLGQEKRAYVRAANTQKCIRAGGKHNDLEDVGRDTYHHTFFEMLGNWSFGDYFKKDAIAWAWELLTKVWGLPKDRLHATVFGGDDAENLAADDEAAELWRTVTDIDPSHIHRGNKKDNFWEMGETGPCGPCSEIHYDGTPDMSSSKLVNAGDPRVIEVWNLVFIQFNRAADGRLSPLPAKHVDTGMGLERITRILQGVQSNYDTDLFGPLFSATHKLCPVGVYGGKLEDATDIAYRVIADHARTLTFAIADGIIPSNEGRGYVVRRILRRAARYGRQYLKIEGEFLHKLVPTVVELMGGFFTELPGRAKYVADTIRGEEESFGKTLDRGIELFQRELAAVREAGKRQLSGEVAFDLYATYGFPVDLTQLMAGEAGMGVDVEGYDEAMARHREMSASEGKFKAADVPNLPATNDSAKYKLGELEARVIGWVVEGKFVTTGSLEAGDEAGVVLDRTNFYGEQGGQVGDAGHLLAAGLKFAVRDTQPAGGGILHLGVLESGVLRAGQTVKCQVGDSRMDTMRNHTATHLLNWALRKILGDHVNQAGSVVESEKLRFDFSHNQSLTDEQLAEAERLVNERVLADETVSCRALSLADAKKITGVRAVFGEKYPDPVRVLCVGADDPRLATEAASVEFCGGTHLERTGRIGLFKIISQESVAKGVRRITAMTGRSAYLHVQQAEAALKAAAALLHSKAEDLPARVAALQKELKEAKKSRPAAAEAVAKSAPETVLDLPGGKVAIIELHDTADANAMRQICDIQRQKGAVAVFAGGTDGQRVMLVAMVSQELAAAGKLKAGAWVQQAAQAIGGKGGGKDTMAQAGAKDPAKLVEAMAAAGEYVRKCLE